MRNQISEIAQRKADITRHFTFSYNNTFPLWTTKLIQLQASHLLETMKHDGMEWIRFRSYFDVLPKIWRRIGKRRNILIWLTQQARKLDNVVGFPSNSNMVHKFGHGPRPLSPSIFAAHSMTKTNIQCSVRLKNHFTWSPPASDAYWMAMITCQIVIIWECRLRGTVGTASSDSWRRSQYEM